MFHRRQLFLGIGKNLLRAAVVAAIAIAAMLILGNRINRISDSLVQNRKLSFILAKRTDTITELRDDLLLLADYVPRLEQALPPANNILEFVGALERIANQNALRQAFHFGIPAPAPSEEGGIAVASVDYSVVLNGTVTMLVNYLQSFEALPYFSGITTLSINAGSPQGWEGNSSITIQGRLYAKQIGI